jgi:catechol 2,3-dioxygenase
MAVLVQSQKSARPLPATLRLGPVELTVTDLERSVEWYETALGLHLHSRADGRAELGDGESASLILVEDRDARPAGRHAGLYHYALLYPTREELARATVRLINTGTSIQGASDHGTHEALYLPDPDGNGIELAADRPRDQWPSAEEEFSRGGPLPLDVENLLATVGGEAPRDRIGDGLRVGHLHLHVGSIAEGLAFYRDVIGFDVWALIDSAAFVSAGGYHHHLGFNVWRGPGVAPAPAHTIGLRHWTVQVKTAAELDEIAARLDEAGTAYERDGAAFVVRDPWQIAMRVEVAA